MWKQKVVLQEVQRRHQATRTAWCLRTRRNQFRIRILWAWNTAATRLRKETRPTREEVTAAEEHGAPVAPGPSLQRYHRIYWTRCLWKPRISTNRGDETAPSRRNYVNIENIARQSEIRMLFRLFRRKVVFIGSLDAVKLSSFPRQGSNRREQELFAFGSFRWDLFSVNSSLLEL